MRDEENYYYKILEYIFETTALDLFNYDASFVSTELEKRRIRGKFENYEAYFAYLKSDKSEFLTLFKNLLVNYSSFFRNGLTFEIIKNKMLPRIFSGKEKEGEDSIRVWSIGCANGEEPYSMAILIKEFMKNSSCIKSVHIFATDIDDDALVQAEKGEYQRDSLEEMKYGLVKKYFKINNGCYRIADVIKELVFFSHYDIFDRTSVPPESIYGDFDIVLFRNVSIYFSREAASFLFKKVCRSVAHGGFLILGEYECLPKSLLPGFKVFNWDSRIYKKKER